MSNLSGRIRDADARAIYDACWAALEAGANLAAYAESVARFGHGTRDGMHNLVQEFEDRAVRARAVLRDLEYPQSSDVIEDRA